MSGVQIAEAKPPKKGPKVLDEIRIKRSMDGGHVITHHYEGYQHDPKPYKFGANEHARAAAHIARHAGFKDYAGEGETSATEEEIDA